MVTGSKNFVVPSGNWITGTYFSISKRTTKRYEPANNPADKKHIGRDGSTRGI